MINLDKLTTEELGRLFPIIMSGPRTEWPLLFLQEKKNIVRLLGGEIALRIEHIGSTAVSDLSAKPTIDILVEIPAGDDIKYKIIKKTTSHGYRYMHEQTDHIMVVKGYTPEGFKGQCYHIHMGPKDCDDLWDRLYFRDYLRSNPSAAGEYAKLKRGLAIKYKYDREAYTEAKTDFIVKMTERAKKELK